MKLFSQFVCKVTHYNDVEYQLVTDLKLIWQAFVVPAWRWLRCKLYFPNPKLGPATSYFINETGGTFAKVGAYIGFTLVRSTPYEHSFGVAELLNYREVPESLIKNILTNVWELKETQHYSFNLGGETDGKLIYRLSFKPRIFLEKVGTVYDFREAEWWERARDYWQIKGNALFNIVSIATIAGGTILLSLLFLLYLVSPKS